MDMSDVQASVLSGSSTLQPLLRTALINSTGTAASNTVVDIHRSNFANFTAVVAASSPSAVVGHPSLMLSLHCSDASSIWCVGGAECVTLQPLVALVSTNLWTFSALPTWAKLTERCAFTVSRGVTQPTWRLTPTTTRVLHSETIGFTASVERSSSTSITHIMESPTLTPVNPDLLPKSTAMMMAGAATGTMVYASLLGGSVTAALAGGSVPALQRASAAVVLSAMCRSSSGDDNEVLFQSFSDNPTHLYFPISGQPSYSYAIGASVNNTIVTSVLAVFAHLLRDFLARRCTSTQHRFSAFQRALVDVLQPSPLPGSLALPFGVLVVPTFSACVVLLSGNAGGGPAAVGAIILLIWVAVPAYFGREVLEAAGKKCVGGRRGQDLWLVHRTIELFVLLHSSACQTTSNYGILHSAPN